MSKFTLEGDSGLSSLNFRVRGLGFSRCFPLKGNRSFIVDAPLAIDIVLQEVILSGDVIEFGDQRVGGRGVGRVRFKKPVAASSSATLELKDGRLKQRDIRNVALLADSLVFGPLGSHFPIAGAEGPIILYRISPGGSDNGGRFAVKQPGMAAEQSLGIGDSMLVGDNRFALSQVSLS